MAGFHAKDGCNKSGNKLKIHANTRLNTVREIFYKKSQKVLFQCQFTYAMANFTFQRTNVLNINKHVESYQILCVLNILPSHCKSTKMPCEVQHT